MAVPLTENIEFSDRSLAIDSIRHAPPATTVIIDLDETLFLRNSTAEYLNTIQPQLLGLLVLKFLNLVKPWKWLPHSFRGSANRDWLLVVVMTCLFPWTIFLWPGRAKRLARDHCNQDLMQALNQNKNISIVIATLGFSLIVNPIIQSFPLPSKQIISCRFWQGFKDRTKGKLRMVQEVLSPKQIAQSIVITDSVDDLPLLKQVAIPCLVIWPLSQYASPMNNIYLPLLYLGKVKRAGQNYFLKSVLAEDFPLLLLAFTWGVNNPLWHSLGILLLLVSFWCIYELGYYENDVVGEKYEEKPVLSEKYLSSKSSPIRVISWQAWIWAVGLGSIGVVALDIGLGLVPLANDGLVATSHQLFKLNILPLAYWTGFLIFSRFCFWIYNYCNKQTRIWLYFLIQSCRYYGFAAVTPINFIGASLLSSNILSRSMLYILYRYAGGNRSDWPAQIPDKFLRLLIFIALLATITIGVNSFAAFRTWQAGVILLWLIVRGTSQIKAVIGQFKLVTQDGSNGAVIKSVSSGKLP